VVLAAARPDESSEEESLVARCAPHELPAILLPGALRREHAAAGLPQMRCLVLGPLEFTRVNCEVMSAYTLRLTLVGHPRDAHRWLP